MGDKTKLQLTQELRSLVMENSELKKKLDDLTTLTLQEQITQQEIKAVREIQNAVQSCVDITGRMFYPEITVTLSDGTEEVLGLDIRNPEPYVYDERKIAALAESIRDTSFWKIPIKK